MAYVFRQTIHVKRRGLDLMDAVGIVDTQHALTTRARADRSEEHTSELQSPCNLVCRLLLEKKNGMDGGLFLGDHTRYSRAIFRIPFCLCEQVPQYRPRPGFPPRRPIREALVLEYVGSLRTL